MLHDPEVFPDPNTFNPDRFEGSDLKMAAVNNIAFGCGRRECPGICFAEGSVFAIVSTVLATCDILPALDSNGREIVPPMLFTNHATVYVKFLHFALMYAAQLLVSLFLLACRSLSNVAFCPGHRRAWISCASICINNLEVSISNLNGF